jgi:prepilin-type N-terminal cleavage/methylation domain-containing protein
MMRRGFTLIEVVIALVVLEIVVSGAVGLLVLAGATLGRAERLERAVALAEGALDSLAGVASRTDGEATHEWSVVRWSVGLDGVTSVVAVGPEGDTLFTVHAVLPP